MPLPLVRACRIVPSVSAPTPAVACLGEALVVLVPTVAGPLEHAATLTRSIAGAEANVAIALVAAGAPAAVITRVGDDGFGRYITSELARLGVGTSAIEVDAVAPTGIYVKDLAPAGDRGRMRYYRTGSAGSLLSPDTLDSPEARSLLTGARVLHTTGITPALSDSARDAQLALLERRAAGQLVSFDLNWRPALWRDREDEARTVLGAFVRRADVAFIGASEASDIWNTTDPAELRAMFPEPRWLIVKNDASDASGFDRDHRVDVPTLHLDVVEPIGAGDAFAAGFLAGLLAGLSLEGCMARAHRMATRALSNTRDHVGDPPAPPVGDLTTIRLAAR
jgi:2-dehydro-3-deoxygluconokinase